VPPGELTTHLARPARVSAPSTTSLGALLRRAGRTAG